MAVVCNFCDATRVEHHCAETNTGCTWLICRGCGALVDWATDKAIDRHGKPLRL